LLFLAVDQIVPSNEKIKGYVVKTADIRKQFLNYFQEQGHTAVESSPLVPGNDPTLLFTNAGMVQFKDVFLGKDKRPYSRATSAQRCVRAGGKHNDLENVGYTARHHTFFEMLGNFSFGDYFKREAITYAWDFLTKVLHLPPERLWITVYETDDEAADIWLNEIKADPKRFSRCGAADNFWSMGDTGPCGPCTEIFYDHGPEIPGGPPGSENADADRYIEIWNLVFMQYNRAADGTLTPLPKPSVDTGMGLERLAAVLQGVHDNYDIDLFRNLLNAIDVLIKKNNPREISQETEGPYHNTSQRVIADHIRSSSFLITDGVSPSNEGRGYVLRRIIRRALRHGHKLGLPEDFFHQLVKPLVAEMGDAYPELKSSQNIIEKVLAAEEQQFARTLTQGLKIFSQELSKLNSQTIPGEIIFRLYDTYGFPVDLTADIAREQGYELDYTGFQEFMQKQREQSQAASQFAIATDETQEIEHYSEFAGYERLEDEVSVIGLFRDGVPVPRLQAGESGWVILNRTPFYAQAGGQVGDQGQLHWPEGAFEVTDTRNQGQAHLHIGTVKSGVLQPDQIVIAAVNGSKRQATALNHTATHLLHAALQRIAGKHVVQKGSLVAPDRLRFDFSHYESLTKEQLTAIEHLVNQQIRSGTAVHTDIMSPEEAKKAGAMALFGEKYADKARVLSIGHFSKELCGGTHVKNTSEIGLFKIISEGAIAAGIRRIEAITGEAALQWLTKMDDDMAQCANLLNCLREELPEKLAQLLTKVKELEKQVQKNAGNQLAERAQHYLTKVTECFGVKCLVQYITDLESKDLRFLAEQLKNKMHDAIIVLATQQNNKVNFVVSVSVKQGTIKADELARYLAEQVGGSGGGRADFAQAGGPATANIEQILALVKPWLEKRIGTN